MKFRQPAPLRSLKLGKLCTFQRLQGSVSLPQVTVDSSGFNSCNLVCSISFPTKIQNLPPRIANCKLGFDIAVASNNKIPGASDPDEGGWEGGRGGGGGGGAETYLASLGTTKGLSGRRDLGSRSIKCNA
jgi:hypothetical protein